jgi:hypothetical protein
MVADYLKLGASFFGCFLALLVLSDDSLFLLLFLGALYVAWVLFYVGFIFC